MAFNIAKAQFIGRLGADPRAGDARGKATLNCRMCANTGRGDRERAVWVSFTLWEKLADAMRDKLSKGDMVYVAGDIELETYNDKDGVERQSLKCSVDEFVLLTDKRGAGGSEFGGREDFNPPGDDANPFKGRVGRR